MTVLSKVLKAAALSVPLTLLPASSEKSDEANQPQQVLTDLEPGTYGVQGYPRLTLEIRPGLFKCFNFEVFRAVTVEDGVNSAPDSMTWSKMISPGKRGSFNITGEFDDEQIRQDALRYCKGFGETPGDSRPSGPNESGQHQAPADPDTPDIKI